MFTLNLSAFRLCDSHRVVQMLCLFCHIICLSGWLLKLFAFSLLSLARLWTCAYFVNLWSLSSCLLLDMTKPQHKTKVPTFAGWYLGNLPSWGWGRGYENKPIEYIILEVDANREGSCMVLHLRFINSFFIFSMFILFLLTMQINAFLWYFITFTANN